MDDEIRRDIQRMVSGNVRFDVPMRDYTSMGVGGPADVLVFPEHPETLGQLVSYLVVQQVPFLPAGNWTNLIVRDGGYRGVLIGFEKMCRVRFLEGQGPADDGYRNLEAQAGASLASLVSLSAKEGLAGLEFCAGIPGSVGGAVKMNAGAYGREMKDVLRSVTIMDCAGQVREVRRDGLSFHYRRLEMPEGHLIVAATYRLDGGEREKIKDQIRDIMAKRKSKHPLDHQNAGSIFKNPEGRPAGQIIEAAGLKGLRVGDAQVSMKHANFIVNLGSARAKDVTTLMDAVREQVQVRTGIRLEAEVVVIGDEA